IKEDLKNEPISNRGSTTNCPTNQNESSIKERKENSYTSNKTNENKTSSNLVSPRCLSEKKQKQRDMLLQILGRLDKLEDQSSLSQTISARKKKLGRKH
ncbi:20704_t:CDS:2, partial [Dentiscutata erythropus]